MLNCKVVQVIEVCME